MGYFFHSYSGIWIDTLRVVNVTKTNAKEYLIDDGVVVDNFMNFSSIDALVVKGCYKWGDKKISEDYKQYDGEYATTYTAY